MGRVGFKFGRWLGTIYLQKQLKPVKQKRRLFGRRSGDNALSRAYAGRRQLPDVAVDASCTASISARHGPEASASARSARRVAPGTR